MDDDLDAFGDINFEEVAEIAPPAAARSCGAGGALSGAPALEATECAQPPGKSKKKRPKKKAQKDGRGNDCAEDEATVDEGKPSEDASARYQSALELLRGDGTDGEAWLSLRHCGIGDKKLRRLTDLMISNPAGSSSLTSVDLSHNAITDAGVASLTHALQQADVTPCLLELSLDANPLTPAGCAACASSLRATFVQIRLLLPCGTPAADAAEAPPAAEAAEAPRAAAVSEGELRACTETVAAWAAGGAHDAPPHEALSTLLRAAEAEAEAEAEAAAKAKVETQTEAKAEAEAKAKEAVARAEVEAEAATGAAALAWCAAHVAQLACAIRAAARARAPKHLPLLLALLGALVRSRQARLVGAVRSHAAPPLVAVERGGRRGAEEAREAPVLDGCVPLMLAQANSPAVQQAVLRLAADVLESDDRALKLQLLGENGRRAAELATVLGKAQRVSNHTALVEFASKIHTAARNDPQLERALQAIQKWQALCWLLF
ncbi:hypothetical protein AB1Y20_014201 [Prymnesium parvum]|uniref:Uncharacterized protein n=1 Tax=Prymnesium parvum TaxID=97485 RepID=A0AB34IFI3_PRYPA